MVNDAHRQSRGASEQSLEQLFRRLEELQMRQEAYEARLGADEQWQRDHEQATKDAIRVLMMTRAQDAPPEPEIPAAMAVGGVNRPGRPQLRVILGGLAVAATAALVPAGAHAVAHHHAPRVAAVRCHDQRGRRCPDADGGRMGG